MNAYSVKFTYMLWFYSKESSIKFEKYLKLYIRFLEGRGGDTKKAFNFTLYLNLIFLLPGPIWS